MKTKSHVHPIVPPEANASTNGSRAAQTTDIPARDPNERPCEDSIAMLFLRVGWFMVGPFAMLLTLYRIATVGRGWATALDGLFFVFLAMTIGCRWLEMRSGHATGSSGQPTTWAHFRRYVAVLVPLAAGAWIVANALGNHLLNGGPGA